MRPVSRCLAVAAGLFAAGLHAEPIAAPEHRRAEEQTFLTFPEWYLVFSPAEFVDLAREGRAPSEFPFWTHTREFWRSYSRVHEAVAGRGYPVNFEYHAMIVTIGVSTSVEYGLRGVYETLVGRLTEMTTSQSTAEDELAAEVAQDYVDFIHGRPWYEYDFTARLRQLWTAVPMSGAGVLRKLERRYALTTEYLAKAGYAWVIAQATHASFDEPLAVTHVVYRRQGGEQRTALLPRYAGFTPSAIEISRTGADFIEIAGNGPDASILVTLLTDTTLRPPAEASVLFEQNLSTASTRKRVAVVVRVGDLAALLRAHGRGRAVIEHVFDY